MTIELDDVTRREWIRRKGAVQKLLQVEIIVSQIHRSWSGPSPVELFEIGKLANMLSRRIQKDMARLEEQQ